jgi:hypothetical protein
MVIKDQVEIWSVTSQKFDCVSALVLAHPTMVLEITKVNDELTFILLTILAERTGYSVIDAIA